MLVEGNVYSDDGVFQVNLKLFSIYIHLIYLLIFSLLSLSSADWRVKISNNRYGIISVLNTSVFISKIVSLCSLIHMYQILVYFLGKWITLPLCNVPL
jgi:hypothetical protein